MKVAATAKLRRTLSEMSDERLERVANGMGIPTAGKPRAWVEEQVLHWPHGVPARACRRPGATPDD